MAQSSSGTFIPTTQVWDVSELRDIDVTKPAFKELLVRMYQNLNSMALSINNKESSFYDTSETVKGQSFFANKANDSSTSSAPEGRQVFNKVINFGALPNAAIKNYAHGIDIKRGFTFTRIYGCATQQENTNPAVAFNAISIPYSTIVLLDISATDVVITTTADYSSYANTYIVLEYVKS
jgi:hypothetical protein